MGKQTHIQDSFFGGDWTKEKLTIINDYLAFYVKALKKLNVKLVYIDAFAGSGKTVLPSGEEIDGSAILALQYDFDEFWFLECDKGRAATLQSEIANRYPNKSDKIHIIIGDCNLELKQVFKSLNPYKRGVMFLDPYSMELNWSVLEEAKKTQVLDIWYLFPLLALTRNMFKELSMPEATKIKINSILGTSEWENELYHTKAQISFFDDDIKERVDFDSLVKFIRTRLENNFPYVSPKSKMFRNSNNGPMFILFFIMTNNSKKAIGLGSKVVGDIFTKMEKLSKEGTQI